MAQCYGRKLPRLYEGPTVAAGVGIEAMSDEQIDSFMLDCALRAGMPAV